MIYKVLFWNIRLVNTQSAFGKLIDLNSRCHYSFIALMEPFQGPDKIQNYRTRLGFDHATVNNSSKIWIFLERGVGWSDYQQFLSTDYYEILKKGKGFHDYIYVC